MATIHQSPSPARPRGHVRHAAKVALDVFGDLLRQCLKIETSVRAS